VATPGLRDASLTSTPPSLIEEAVEATREAARLFSEDEQHRDEDRLCEHLGQLSTDVPEDVLRERSTVQRGRQSVRLWRRWSRATSGRSARRARLYSRDVALDSVSTRAADPADESWQTSDFDLLTLANDTYAVRYALRQGGRRTRRVTIWRRGEGQWQVLYHQGAVVTDDA